MRKIAIPLLIFPHKEIAGVGYYVKAFFQSITHDDLELYDFYITFYVTGDYDHRTVFSIPTSRRISVYNIRGLNTPVKRILFELFAFKKYLSDFNVIYCLNPCLVCLPKNIKKIVTIHDMVPFLSVVPIKRLSRIYRKLIFKYDSRRANLFTTVSQNSKDDMIKILHIPEQKIRLVYMISPLDKRSIGGMIIPPSIANRRYFVYCGRIVKYKNIDNLILAFLHYCQVNNDFETLFYIIGTGLWTNKVKKLVPVDFEKRILFLGYVDEQIKLCYLKSALAMVFCSYYEGFGIPVLEAINLGTPVIVSNVSSLPEIAGNAGLKVDPHDVKNISQAMIDIQKETVRQELISHMDTQLDKFNKRKQVIKLLNCFNE